MREVWTDGRVGESKGTGRYTSLDSSTRRLAHVLFMIYGSIRYVNPMTAHSLTLASRVQRM